MPARIGFFVAGTLSMLSVAAAAGASWVMGSSFDPATSMASYFARYVAAPGDGQMTVRCDTVNGITLDTAVTGNGQPPPGVTLGGEAVARVVLTGGGEHPADLGGTGVVSLRPDGAVIIGLAGEEARRLAEALMEPADSAEITVGEVSASVSLAGAAEAIATIAKACPTWSR